MNQVSTPTPVRVRDADDMKQRLLDAAERLFAERGFSGTTMRAVTNAAGVGVSAANYHFGSKDALLAATIGRVVGPINQARFERLDQLEEAAGDADLDLREVLDAFLRPSIEARGEAFRRVAARLFSDPPEVVASLKQEHFGEVHARFVPALVRALPDRDPARVELEFQFLVGLMVHVISDQIATRPKVGAGEAPTDEGLIEMTIRFAAAGFES